MKTNSNTYTIIYSAVIVVIVAFLLAFVFQALKPAQDANVALDKQKQILYALNLDHNNDRNLSNEEAEKLYKEAIVADAVIDVNGKVTEQGTQGGTEAGFKLNSKDAKEGKLAVYRCTVKGETKYVLPVYGMGLWGAISGYIALNADKETVYGAYFNHESETAGLGAEIKDNPKYQLAFVGKHLFKDGDDKIALSMSKKPADSKTEVDAVTGATLTSNGVTDMLHNGLQPYVKFLKEK